MMRRSGRVAAADDGRLVVRFERAPACGGCHAAKVCGSAHTTELVLDSPGTGHRAGDAVEVEIEGAAALRALAVTHLLPLLALLAAMAGASLIAGLVDTRLGDAAIAGFSFAGLGLGLIASRRLARHPALQPSPRLCSDPTPACPASDHPE